MAILLILAREAGIRWLQLWLLEASGLRLKAGRLLLEARGLRLHTITRVQVLLLPWSLAESCRLSIEWAWLWLARLLLLIERASILLWTRSAGLPAQVGAGAGKHLDL